MFLDAPGVITRPDD